MARTLLERLQCDRCRDEDIVATTGNGPRADWAIAHVESLDREMLIADPSDDDLPAVLCPACVAELMTWYRQSVTERLASSARVD